MARKVLWSGDTVLPAPTAISVNDEIIWSSNTGRTASGLMVGDVVAQKKNISIEWGVLKESELALIKRVMIAGFFPFSFRDDGIDITISSYRGTLSKKQLGWLGDGIFYYKSASVSVIQKYVDVVYMNAQIRTDGSSTATKTIQKQELYEAHKEECRADMAAFDQMVYELEDAQGGAAK